MSDRSAFLAHLHEHPGDETARLVFADWLEDHGEREEAVRQRAMAPGYRALAQLGRVPEWSNTRPLFDSDTPAELVELAFATEWCAIWWPEGTHEGTAGQMLPWDWLEAIESPFTWVEPAQPGVKTIVTREFLTVEAATDAAALAFAKLPSARQAELLAQEVPT